ncbi:actin binding protein [Marasmius tenuissimus]|nr:actin binding protein [Marasmius tenuissimus]
MFLQVNLSSKEIREAYLDALNSHESGGTDWAIFTYEGGTNDLKAQGTGDGGLEELEEEFTDGWIQYAFMRVADPNVRRRFSLFTIDADILAEQYPEIRTDQSVWRWCPVAKKSCFIPTRVWRPVLKGPHVVTSVRNEVRLLPPSSSSPVLPLYLCKTAFQ